MLATAKPDPVRQLGPYQLLRKIGSGGMAEVWAARLPGTHAGQDSFVAIKLLASHLAERREYRDMFLAEAKLSMQLSHPNIVRVFDVVAHETDCYMVMELISGMTLSQLERSLVRERQALPIVVAAYVVGELLRALSYAHTVKTEEGAVIVHRDVSPQNVMVTSEGQVKLMDFGIARFATQETQGAFVKGKLQYMPPEQLRKQTRKPTVDLYAVGAILHELLDGKRFRGRIDQGQLINMVMRGEVPPLRNPDGVPGQIDVVRKGLLEPDEGQRIQTARKALGMLCRWPEYREAANDLRALVQRYVDPAALFEVPEGSRVSSVPEGSFSGLAGYDSSNDTHDDLRSAHSDPYIQAAARTEPTGSELTGEDDLEVLSADDVVAVPEPRERRSNKLIPALVGVGVVALLGVAFLAMSGDEQPDAGEPAERAAANPSEPPAEVAAELVEPEPEPEPEPKLDLGGPPGGTETGTGPEASDEPDEPDEPGPGPQRPAVDETPRVEVPVEFVANEFFFVYVKVGGKVLTLEPRAKLELPDGRHTVYLRQSPDDKWTRAGRITIEPGQEYRVEMRKPAGLELVKK